MSNLFIQMNEVRRRASARVQGAPHKVARTIDEPGHPDRSSRDPSGRGNHHVKDNCRSATCRFRPRRACDGGRHIACTGGQGRASQAQRAERQCQDGAPSPQAFTSSSRPQADRCAQEPSVLEGYDQACDACHQARLKRIREGSLHPHCPALSFADIGPGPRVIASPMAPGRCRILSGGTGAGGKCGFPLINERARTRRGVKLLKMKTDCICGHQQSAQRW
jgi:hypothetical protein